MCVRENVCGPRKSNGPGALLPRRSSTGDGDGLAREAGDVNRGPPVVLGPAEVGAEFRVVFRWGRGGEAPRV